jgi:hypothetical protein
VTMDFQEIVMYIGGALAVLLGICRILIRG